MATRAPQVVALVATATGAYVLAHIQDQPHHAVHHHHHAEVVALAPTTAANEPDATHEVPSTKRLDILPAQAWSIIVYASRIDGQTLVPRRILIGPTLDRQSTAYLAAVQAVTGPPDKTRVVRFPHGTVVREVNVAGDTAHVDMSKAIEASASGGFTESGEFKALVWTMTALPGVDRVRVTVDGRALDTLPGGHLELDVPLRRSDF